MLRNNYTHAETILFTVVFLFFSDAVFLTGVGVRDNNGYQLASFNDDV